MLVTDLELRPWCPVHVAPLVGEPRLCFDHQTGWFLVLAGMSCPKTTMQSECIQKWISHILPTEISPAACRALSKTETTL